MTTLPDSRETLLLKRRMGLGPTAARSGAGAFSLNVHTHVESEVTGLVADLANRAVLDAGNTFAGAQDVFEHVHANSQLSTDGTVAIEEGVIDGTLLTGAQTYQLPDASGVFALTSDLTGLGLILAYRAASGTDAIGTSDCVLNYNGTFTATLPTAVGVAGKVYILKNSGAGTITLATTSSQTIDGAAPGTIAAGNSLTLVSTGANWIIV